MGQIRDSILKQMLKSGLTIYQVSKMVRDKVPQRTVYAFLTGEKDTGTETASILMRVLGLAITDKSNKVTFLERDRNMDKQDDKVRIFVDDDGGYLQWVEQNPTGFIVNSFKQPSPKYLILHRASCWTISTRARTNWTTTGFIKICSSEETELETWAEREVGGELHHCRICNP